MISVLYVDDEEDLLVLGRIFLERGDQFRVDTATSAKDAIEVLKKKKYDAILSDYQMPDMNGIEFLQIIRSSGNTVPFIIFTGKGREDIVIQALNEGADFYLQKGGEPLSQFAELAHKIRTAVQRKTDQEQLRFEQQKNLRILEEVADTFYSLDREWRFTLVNPAAERSPFNKPSSDLIGQVIWDLYPALIGTPIYQHYQEAMRKQCLEHYEAQSPLNHHWYEVFMQGHADGVDVFMRDITPRIQAESDLKEREQETRRILEQAGIGHGYFHLDGTLVILNDIAAERMGGTVGSLIGRSLCGIYGKKTGEKYQQRILASAGQSEPLEYEDRVTLPDGTRWYLSVFTRVCDESGTVKGVQFFSHDITGRKEAEDVIRESEEKFRTLFNHMTTGVFYQNRDKTLVDMNPAALSLLGVTHAQGIDRDPYDSGWKFVTVEGKPLKPEDRPSMVAMRTGVPVYHQVLGVFNPHKDEYAWLIVNAEPQFRPGEKDPFRVFVTFEDVTDLLRAEKDLKESEEQYRTLFEKIPVGFARHEIILDSHDKPVDYRFLQINPAFEELTGLSRDRIPGARATELLPGIETSWIETYGEVALHGKPIQFENYSSNLDRWYAVRAYRPAPMQFVTLFFDITARKQVEDRLRESEERFRLSIENNMAGYFRIGRDGRFEKVNAAWLALHGYDSPDEVIGEHYSITQQDQDFEKAQKNVEGLLRGLPIPSGEFSRLRKDGSVGYHIFSATPFFAKGTVAGVEGFIIDTTDRILAEKAEKESEAKYRNLIDNIHDIIWETTNDLRFTFISPAQEKITGIPHEEMLNRSLLEVITPESADEVRKRLAQRFLEAKNGTIAPATVFEVAMEKENGDMIWLEVSATPIIGPDLLLDGFRGITRDITGRKQADEALQRLNHQLDLLNSVTRHDITNKVSIILGNLDLAVTRSTDPAVIQRLHKIGSAITAIQAQIDFMKDYQELGSHKPHWIKVDSLIRELQLPSSVVLNADLHGIYLYADPLLEKVFFNLLDNSLRHGGEITSLQVGAFPDPGGLTIVWEDDGRGVPTGEKDCIFERGYGKNTGYGLFLIREILAITGMTIREAGVPHGGARFEILVPKGMYRVE